MNSYRRQIIGMLSGDSFILSLRNLDSNCNDKPNKALRTQIPHPLRGLIGPNPI
jgi:hypothetical protein